MPERALELGGDWHGDVFEARALLLPAVSLEQLPPEPPQRGERDPG